MKKLLNDRGYALLIVLFTIIIFLSMSAVFMSASLNHVKQEQTVDQKNQAVVASEMGVKLVSTDILNNVESQLKLIEAGITSKQKEYLSCLRTIGCNREDAKELLEDYYTQKISDFDYYVKNTLMETIQLKYEVKNIRNNDLKFELNNIEVASYENRYELNLLIKGILNSRIERNLDATLKFRNVASMNVSNSQPIESSFTLFPDNFDEKCIVDGMLNSKLFSNGLPYNCKLVSGDRIDDLLVQIDSKKLNPSDFNVNLDTFSNSSCRSCSASSVRDLKNLNLFVKHNVDFGSINNMKNFQVYTDGKFVAENANNLGKHSSYHNFLIARELDVKQANGTGISNTTIVLLGDEEGRNSVFQFDKKFFVLNESSNFCINLDNFSEASKQEVVAINGSGKVIYYAKEKYDKFVEKNDKNNDKHNKPDYIFIDNQKTFLNMCGVDSFKMVNMNSEVVEVNY